MDIVQLYFFIIGNMINNLDFFKSYFYFLYRHDKYSVALTISVHVPI